MSIQYINGHRLRKAMIAGCMQLIKNKDHLNRINVFPVADGDTGSNMAATMRAILQRSYNSYEPSIAKFSNSIAESALLGARGNSGAILAQFFTGLAEGLKGRFRVNVSEFGIAVEKAAAMAMEALSNPREGTILSVMKSWAHYVRAESEKEGDFKELLKKSLVQVKIALDNTPNQLEVLKKANVVDSGAQGFVNLVEGIVQFLTAGTVREEEIAELENDSDIDEESEPHIEYDPESIQFQFCTEFLLQGEGIDKTKLRGELLALGDSMIVAGSSTKVKVHIHSNEPEKVFDVAATYGTLLQRKAEDMKAQHHEAWGKDHPPFPYGILIDSSCDIHPNYIRHYEIKMVALNVIMNEKQYLDKETITAGEFYGMLEDDRKINPKTSLPTPAKFKSAFMETLKNRDEIIYFGLSSTVSGTFQSGVTIAKQLKEQFPDKKIHLLDSKLLTTAAGFALQEIVERVEKGDNIETIMEAYEQIKNKIDVYCYIDTVEYLVRGGRLSKAKGFIATLLRLNPVITVSPEGGILKVDVVRNRKRAVQFLLGRLAKDKKIKRIGIFHAANLQSAVDLETEFRKFDNSIDIPVNELSPVLGSHSGPGAFGFTVQYE